MLMWHAHAGWTGFYTTSQTLPEIYQNPNKPYGIRMPALSTLKNPTLKKYSWLLIAFSGARAGLEFALFLIPVSIVPYMPNFFFGSLLMLFGLQICTDWLVMSYKKVHRLFLYRQHKDLHD